MGCLSCVPPQCVQPWTNNPFNGLIGLRVVAEEGYLGMVMAVQVIPIPVCLEPSTHHRSNFMSMEKIIEALLSKRRKRAISATASAPSVSNGSSASAAIAEGLRRGRSRMCRHECDHSHSSGKTLAQPPWAKGGHGEEDWGEDEGNGREASRPEVVVVPQAMEAQVPGLGLQQGATPSKIAFDDSSLLDDLTDDDGGNRDSTVDADLDNWPLDLEELDGLPFMRMHTSPTQGLDLPPMTTHPCTTACATSNVATGGGGMPFMHSDMLPPIPPHLQGPMMDEMGERRMSLPGSAFPGPMPGPMRGPAEARGLPHPHPCAMGWTTEDGYLVDDSNRDSSTTIASEEFEPGFGNDMYRFLPWMEVDPPNAAAVGEAAMMTMEPPAGNHALPQQPLQHGQVHQQHQVQQGGTTHIFPSHEW